MTETIKPYPMLAHFSAAWCGPCKAMEPAIEALKIKNATRMGYQKIDVDAETDLAEKHNVRSVPTLLMMVWDGTQWVEKARLVGARSAAALEQFAEGVLSTETI